MSAENTYLMSIEEWANVYFGRTVVAYIAFLKSTGISIQQANALTYLHYNAPGKITELCEHMMVSAAAASQMVDRLEKQDLVARNHYGDRRTDARYKDATNGRIR